MHKRCDSLYLGTTKRYTKAQIESNLVCIENLEATLHFFLPVHKHFPRKNLSPQNIHVISHLTCFWYGIYKWYLNKYSSFEIVKMKSYLHVVL